jgi:hypothetical protein
LPGELYALHGCALRQRAVLAMVGSVPADDAHSYEGGSQVSLVIQIADAVAGEMNERQFSKAFVAVRAYRPLYELSELAAILRFLSSLDFWLLSARADPFGTF